MTNATAGRFQHSIEAWLFRAGAYDRRVLLLKVRAEPGAHPGFWQPVTGGVQPGEPAEQACLREIAEETSLRLSPHVLTVVMDSFDVAISPELTVRKRVFAAPAPPGAVRVAPDEHEDHRWVSSEAVEGWLYWASNRTTWAHVRARLRC